MRINHLLATLYWRGVFLSPGQFATLLQRLNQNEDGSLVLSQLSSWGISTTKLQNWKELGEEELQWCQDHEVNVVSLGDENYPQWLMIKEKPPLVFTYWGELPEDKALRLGVVGSRAPREESLLWMDRFLSEVIKKENLIVLSGGARGIDQKAHGLCLRYRAKTLAFLPSGLSKVYPKSFEDWISRILEVDGCIISQFSPFAQMQKSHFHIRNDFIAASCQALLVVQAGLKSGTMVTVKKALKYNIPVGVVPSHPLNSNSLGGIKLIQEGAWPVLNEEDVFSLLV